MNDSPFAKPFYEAVRRQANTTRKLRADINLFKKAQRIAAGAPEVMVKITGFSKGTKAVYSNLTYVTRNGDVELETDAGRVISGREEVKEYFQDWKADLSAQKPFKDRRDSMHLVLSMPPGTEDEAVKGAVRDFARATFGGRHEYAFALHTDEKHPHCHLIVKYRGFDGSKPVHNPEAIQEWRETFAEKMRQYGVDAEASPRQVRGVVKKAEKQAVRHIDKRYAEKGQGRVSRVTAMQVDAARKMLAAEAAGQGSQLHQEAVAALRRNAKVREAWLAAALSLEQSIQPLTIKGKVLSNERPNYSRAAGRAGGQLRSPSLRQSSAYEARREAPPQSHTGLRHVSNLNVVWAGRTTEMLLHANALRSVGWKRAADYGLRRTREGTASAGEREGRRVAPRYATTPRELAAQIRTFVQKMPPAQTRVQEMKEALRTKFTVAQQTKGVNVQPQQNEKRNRDIER